MLNKQSIALQQDLGLTPITIADSDRLLKLMQRIYPPPYAHLWNDHGEWYVHHTYNKNQLATELAQTDCPYYFVAHKQQEIGVLRLCHGLEFPAKPGIPASKLHRIYLDEAVVGQGIGKRLMEWSAQQTKAKGNTILWLEAMEVQSEARSFYEYLGYVQKGKLVLPFDGLVPGKEGMIRYYLEV